MVTFWKGAAQSVYRMFTVGGTDISEHSIKIIIHYKRIGYTLK